MLVVVICCGAKEGTRTISKQVNGENLWNDLNATIRILEISME